MLLFTRSQDAKNDGVVEGGADGIFCGSLRRSGVGGLDGAIVLLVGPAAPASRPGAGRRRPPDGDRSPGILLIRSGRQQRSTPCLDMLHTASLLSEEISPKASESSDCHQQEDHRARQEATVGEIYWNLPSKSKGTSTMSTVRHS